MTIEGFRELSNGSAGRGHLLERLVAAMHVAETPDVEVRWSDVIGGRQFDVTLRFRKGVHDYLTVIECKDFAGAVPVEKVEAFVTKASNAGANKAVMVSSAGFQSGAVAVARRHGIRLLTIEEVISELEPLPGKSVDGIAFVSLKFIVAGSSTILDFPSRSPRFAYVWRQGKIRRGTNEMSIEACAQSVRPTDFTTLPTRREEATIELTSDAILSIPHEDPVRVSSMTYARMPERLRVASQLPGGTFLGFDPFLSERLQLSFILRDEEGKVVQQEELRDLPFGFDTELSTGTFYESPALGFHYYLEKIEPNLLTWVAIETYQHGMLLQARFTQKPQFAKGMVAVTNPDVLKRLHRMLKAFKERET